MGLKSIILKLLLIDCAARNTTVELYFTNTVTIYYKFIAINTNDSCIYLSAAYIIKLPSTLLFCTAHSSRRKFIITEQLWEIPIIDSASL